MTAEEYNSRQPYSHSREGATTSDRYPATFYQSNSGNSDVGPPVRIADERTSATVSNVPRHRGSYYPSSIQADDPTVNAVTAAEGDNWVHYQPPLIVHPTPESPLGVRSSVQPPNTPQAFPDHNVATTSAYSQTYRHGESYARNHISTSNHLNPNSNTPQYQSTPPDFGDQPRRQYYQQQQHQRGIGELPIAAPMPPPAMNAGGGQCQCPDHVHIRYHDAGPAPVQGIYTPHTVTIQFKVPSSHNQAVNVNASHAHPPPGSAYLVYLPPAHTNVVVLATNVAVWTHARPVQGVYYYPPPSISNTPENAGAVYNQQYSVANAVPGSSSGAQHASHPRNVADFDPGNSGKFREEEEEEEETVEEEGIRIKEEEIYEDFDEESDEEEVF